MDINITLTPYERDMILAKLYHAVRGIKTHAEQRERQGRELEKEHAKRLIDLSVLIAKLEGTRAPAITHKGN